MLPNVSLLDESQVDSRGGHRNIALVDETRSAHLLRQLFWNRRYINLHAMQKSKCVKYPCVKVLLHLIYTIVPLRQKTTGNKSMRVKKHYTLIRVFFYKNTEKLKLKYLRFVP